MKLPPVPPLLLIPYIALTVALCGCSRTVNTMPEDAQLLNKRKLLSEVIAAVTPPTNYKVTMHQGSGEAPSEFIFYEKNKLAYVIIDTAGNRLHIDYEKRLLTAYDKDRNRALAMPMDETTRTQPPFITANDMKQDVPIENVEKLNGIECWRVRTTMPTPTAEAQEVTAWIDTTHGLIQKIESKNRIAITFEYSSIDKLDRSDYVLPDDVTMVRVGDKPSASN